jgi:hypothetical protein
MKVPSFLFENAHGQFPASLLRGGCVTFVSRHTDHGLRIFD